MEHNIFNTLEHGERVTSSYAEIYHNDDYCDVKQLSSRESTQDTVEPDDDVSEAEEWVSPSDLLIGIIELKPPFTSKLTRGRTHEGILSIGGEVLQAECDAFMNQVTHLLHDNDAAWSNILKHEKEAVIRKVSKIYDKILQDKSNILKKEISVFYEKTLKELEDHVKSEVKTILINTRASIVEELDKKIKQKLAKEKKKLEAILLKRYNSEVTKIKNYYRLLLDNELLRYRKLVNKSIVERNEALKSFYKQVEAENITSTMYVMCMERKKCKIKKFIVQSCQDMDMKAILKKIQEKEKIIEDFQKRVVHISDLNKEWEEKIRKILELFLKFISFSLKLLPEQSTFLLDFQKMVVLQLNEIQKNPSDAPPILISNDNIITFEEEKVENLICNKEPFVIEGDTSITPPPEYGSRESLAQEVDLPYFRVQRQYIYAKCHKFEEIKDLLEIKRCKCQDMPPKVPSHELSSKESQKSVSVITPVEKKSSNELFIVDDIGRLQECPVRNCKDWAQRNTFPYLNAYLDYTEENYKRVTTILGKPEKFDPLRRFIDPNDITHKTLQFSPTNEPVHTVGTQYSSQEDLYEPELVCPCLGKASSTKTTNITSGQHIRASKSIDEILKRRKISLIRLMQEKPNLLKMFTDESFDFIL